MVKFTSFLFRDKLEDRIEDIMNNEFSKENILNNKYPIEKVGELKAILQFNYVFVDLAMEQISNIIMKRRGMEYKIFDGPKKKSKVKDAIVATKESYSKIKDYNIRTKLFGLIEKYERGDGQFYKDMPFDGRVFINESEGVINIERAKRLRRIGEKVRSRIIQILFDLVTSYAQNNQKHRERTRGTHNIQEDMDDDWEKAEQQIADEIKNGKRRLKLTGNPINDIIGMKCITKYGEKLDDIDKIFSEKPFRIENRKTKRNGPDYLANHIQIVYEYPKELLTKTITELYDSGSHFIAEAKELMKEAEKEIIFEAIAIDKANFIYSEDGKTMHEKKVKADRYKKNEVYQAFLADNVEEITYFIMKYGEFNTLLEEFPLQIFTDYEFDTFAALNEEWFGMP